MIAHNHRSCDDEAVVLANLGPLVKILGSDNDMASCLMRSQFFVLRGSAADTSASIEFAPLRFVAF